MLIQKIIGGLGNQLNEYAYAYSVSKYLGQELVLDISDYCSNGYFRPYCLDKLNIPEHKKIIYPFETNQVCTAGCIPGCLKKDFLVVEQEIGISTREDLLQKIHGEKNIYLNGYGGLHYCTPEEKTEILSMFQLKKESSCLQQFKKEIEGKHSVAIHVRRTDFVGLQWANSETYYKAAIAYIRLFYPQAHFYFFSDDIDFVKKAFGNCGNYHYVHLLGGMDADMDEFFCIAACTHRILSSKSSYSDWAGTLQQNKNKMDICYGEADSPTRNPERIYLNDSAIETLSHKCYEDLPPSPTKYNYKATLNNIYDALEKNENDKVISAIDEMSLDSFPLYKKATRELMTLKAIANAQKGDEFISLAVHSFYRQMQFSHEDPVFHHNFFLVLLQAGRELEAAIHASLAEKFSEKSGEALNLEDHFKENTPAYKLYQLIRKTPKRHFVFAPVEGWSFFLTYTKTLAVLLARMGHKVSFISRVIDVNDWKMEEQQILQELLQMHTPADSVYNYHLDLFNCAYRMVGNRRKFYYDEMIQALAKQEKMKTVAVVSHPQALPKGDKHGIPYLVPDITSINNMERYYFQDQLSSYLLDMGTLADDLFLSDPKKQQILQPKCRAKLHLVPDTPWPKGYEIITGSVDFTPNYMESDVMFLAAAEILQVSTERLGDC